MRTRTPLIEREEQLEVLSRLLDDARGGSGRIVFVGGEAGVGKTSLVGTFCADLPSGVRVLWGACDPLSTPRPLGPFHDMAQRDESVARALELSDRHERMTGLLGELTRQTVMVVDDAHWADGATLDVLRFVGRRVQETQGLVLVTYRGDEITPDHPLRTVLGDLSTAPGHRRLDVVPLSPDGVRELASTASVDPSKLYRATGGNPFYVTEALAAPGGTVPPTVSDAVLGRAARLSPAARQLLDVVAIAPGGLEPDLAVGLAAGDEGALDECLEQTMLVISGELVVFRHELARQAVESAISRSLRRRSHQRLLEALEGLLEIDPTRMAHHAEAAGDDARVLRYSPEAGREAVSRGAHREAAHHFERAAACSERGDLSDVADFLSNAAGARTFYDDPAELMRLRQRTVELRRQVGDVRGEAEELVELARAMTRSGLSYEADEIYAHAVSLLEAEPSGAELGRACTLWASLQISGYRADEALALTSRAIEIAESIGDMEQLSAALSIEGEIEMFCFEHVDGLAKQLEGLRLARLTGDHGRIAAALYSTGGNLTEVRRVDEAVPYLQDAISFGEARDLDFYVAQAQSYLARARLGQGRWDEADLLVDEALERSNVSYDIAVTALTVRALVLARRGQAGGEAILEDLWDRAANDTHLYVLWPLAAARAETRWLAGRSHEIPDLVTPTFARVVGRAPWAAGELAFWLWRADALRDPPDRLAGAFALQIAGDWRAAAEAWARIGCPYEQADALADGDEPAMREALTIFTRLGAQPAADRVRACMRQIGVEHVPTRPRATTRAAPAGLTRRQLEVLTLLGAGRTNADIARELYITEKTAEHHVSAVLRKLGVGTRGEAAAAARKIGVGES